MNNNTNELLIFAVFTITIVVSFYFSWKIFRTKGYSGWLGIATGIMIFVLSSLLLSRLVYTPIVFAIILIILHFTLQIKNKPEKGKISIEVKKENVKKESEQNDMISPVKKLHDQTHGSDNIFLSYRRTDSPYVSGRIYDRLAQHFGPEKVFKDVDSIPLGIDFKEHLDRMVTKCEVLLVVIGEKWVTAKSENGQRRLDDPNDFVRIEISSALKRDIPIIPLLVQGAIIPTIDELPLEIGKLSFRNGIFIRSDPDFHKDMDRLNTEIEKIVSN